MKKIELKSRKLLRTIFGCVSLTAVAFVFQACYGTGPDCFYDVKFTGIVKAKDTNLPIKGIKVAINDKVNFGITDENGKFDFYASIPQWEGCYHYKDSIYSSPDSVRVHFLDIDSLENGYFFNKTIIVDPAHKNEVKINVELERQ
jgi:hypothetical protein